MIPVIIEALATILLAYIGVLETDLSRVYRDDSEIGYPTNCKDSAESFEFAERRFRCVLVTKCEPPQCKT